MSIFHGVYTALVTPFSSDAADVDFDRLLQNVDQQATAGVTGVVPCGTTGETPTLTDGECEQVVARVIDAAHTHGLKVIPGAGSNSTRHAVELHRRVHAAGADAALQVCPYYNKPSQEGLYQHFMSIADACDLPIMLYNIPGRTGVCLSIETIERLAAHPNIQAIKDATGSLGLAEQTMARTDLAVMSGDDPLTLPLMCLGGTGVVSVLSNVMPDLVVSLCRAIDGDDLETARRYHGELLPLAEALLTLAPNPVPVKTALEILGRDTGAVRLPLVNADADLLRTLEQILHAYRSAPAASL